MEKDRILFVDDESSILQGLELMLFKQRKRWKVCFAQSGKEGLEQMRADPFNVVVSDMRMPGMDGIAFLKQIKEIKPTAVCMMLTGNTDFDTALNAVNKGNVFRFITKPCEADTLVPMIEAGVEQYRLITAESELLNDTLNGCVNLLIEVLTMTNARAFHHALWLRDMVRGLTKKLQIDNSWEILLAAMLAQISHVALPYKVADKLHRQEPLTAKEAEQVTRLPELSHNLLNKIPRLDAVAQIVLYQTKHFDGSGYPEDAVRGASIPLGSRLIKILNDMADLAKPGEDTSKIIEQLAARAGWYDMDLARQVEPHFYPPPGKVVTKSESGLSVALQQLQLGDRLLAPVETVEGYVIVGKGMRIGPTHLDTVFMYADLEEIKEPLLVERAQYMAEVGLSRKLQ